MHPVIEDHPTFAEFDARRAKLDAERVEGLGAAKAARANYERALVATPPSSPPPPAPQLDAADVDRRYNALRASLDDERRVYVRDHADELAGLLFDAEDAVVAKAAKLVAQLDRLLDEHLELVGTLSRVRTEAGLPTDHQRGFGGEPFTFLVVAARNDTRFLRRPFTDGVAAREAGSRIYSGAPA